MKHLKIYILILDDVDLGHAMLACAHGALSCYLRTKHSYPLKWRDYLDLSFRKVVCKVTKEQLDKAVETEQPFVFVTESGLDNRVTAAVFVPMSDPPKLFRSFPLYKA